MALQTVALIHSPLVGPLTWQPVAEALQARGYDVVVPVLSAAFDERPPYYAALTQAVIDAVQAAGPAPLVLVPHSNAGHLIPSVVAALRAPAAGVIFVDAALPHPGVSFLDDAPEELAQTLRQLATGGRLPRWNEWFPPGTLDTILPGPELRSRFVAELSRVPLAYFQEPAPLAGGWRQVPCRYLRLSDAYDETAAHARRQGWPVTRYDGHHLSMITDPNPVTDHLEAMLSGL